MLNDITPNSGRIINNALACYYDDIEEYKNAIKCWATVCSNGALSLCPDEVMFASTATANIYGSSGIWSDGIILFRLPC